MPLGQKIQLLKQQMEQEGRQLRKEEISDVALSQITHYLYLIGDFLKGCAPLRDRPQNPFGAMFVDIWRFIQDIVGHFINLDIIVEYAIRIVKSSMRILGRNFDQYLIEFLQNVIRGFEVSCLLCNDLVQQNHLASFIYAVEFCFADYAANRDFETIFMEAFNHISLATHTQVLVDAAAFQANPEVVYDFFGFCCRLLRSEHPAGRRIFFSSPQLEGILAMWIRGIGVDHRDAIKMHTEFIQHLLMGIRSRISQGGPIETMQQLDEAEKVIRQALPDVHPNEVVVWRYLLQQGQFIVDATMKIILEAPSRDIVDYYTDILVYICE